MLEYLLFSAIVIGGLYVAYRWWAARIDKELAEGAEVEYGRLKNSDPELVGDLTEARFAELYRKTEMPRAPGYVLAIIAVFLIGTPIMLGLLAGGDWAMNRFGIIPNPSEVVGRFMLNDDGEARLINDMPPEALQYYVRDLGGFYYFFGMLFFWGAIVWFFMSRFHQRRPGFLRDELIRER